MADDDTTTDETETEETEVEEDEYVPPTKEELEAERTKAKADLAKLRGEAKTWRLKAQGKPAPAKKDDAAKTDDDEATQQLKATASSHKAAAVRASAKAELLAAGLQLDEDRERAKTQLTMMLRTIDLDAVDIDSDGDLIGLDVDAIKDAFPERFGKGRPAVGGKKITKVDGASKGGGKEVVETSANKLAKLVVGNG
jgi:hypothetical protein